MAEEKRKFKVGDRVVYDVVGSSRLKQGALGTVTVPEPGRLDSIQQDRIDEGTSIYVVFDGVTGYNEDGAGWVVSSNSCTLLPTSTPTKGGCACPIKDLLSFGHSPSCPEKRA